mgnify:CR=1 FL=1
MAGAEAVAGFGRRCGDQLVARLLGDQSPDVEKVAPGFETEAVQQSLADFRDLHFHHHLLRRVDTQHVDDLLAGRLRVDLDAGAEQIRRVRERQPRFAAAEQAREHLLEALVGTDALMMVAARADGEILLPFPR